uniref:Uncharacterized protein n=1 Tax=Crouania attenuata TaxID=42002 RepID=A0A4D6WPY8_9FLOR|nr:hypothetical protein [Crouania attenuata]
MNSDTTKQISIPEKINLLNQPITKNQKIQTIEKIAKYGLRGQESLLNFLENRRLNDKKTLSFIDSFIFDSLFNTEIPQIYKKLYQIFPNGLIHLPYNLKLNYNQLQHLLMNRQFQEADKLTQEHLCELAGLKRTSKRQWLYFTDIPLLPSEDLFMIDLLWKTYSKEKFGFSIQRSIWLSNECNWDILWEKIGWSKNGNMCRYPMEFIWGTEAPKGHLPLFNQLRGTQVLLALFRHFVWIQNNDEQ